MNWRGLIGHHPLDLTRPVGASGTSVLSCPFCGKAVHAWHPTDLRHPDDIAAQAELFAVEHFRRHHPRRLWLYRRTGWEWPVAGWFH
jgi:hypothetical protein